MLCRKRNRGARLPILISLVAIAAVMMVSLAPSDVVGSLRTQLPAALEHALAYAALGAVVSMSLRLRSWSAGIVGIVGLTMLAAILETAQLFVPGRSFWISDIVGSASGACLGVLAGMMLNRVVTTVRNRRNAALLRKHAEAHPR